MSIKKFIYPLLLLPVLSFGQSYNVAVFPYGNTVLVSSWPITDDFESYTTGSSIDGQGEWVVVKGDIEINTHDGDKGFDGDDVFFNMALYDVEIDDDQYSEIVAEAKINYACPGPAVRVTAGSGGSGYLWYSESSTSAYLVRMVNGSHSFIVTGTAGWSDDDEVRLEIDGYELSFYRNGVLDTSMSGDGKYTDTSGDKIATGSVGIMVYENSGSAWGDTWEGGEL